MMKNRCLKALLAFASLSLTTASAFALPRAAEDADAPVTVGADVARPRIAAKPVKAHAKTATKKKVVHGKKAHVAK
jgi:hypothetical protein